MKLKYHSLFKGTSRPIVTSDDDENDECAPNCSRKPAPTPRQDALKAEIDVMHQELEAMTRKRDAGLADNDIQQKIIKVRKSIDKKKTELKNKVVRAQNMKDQRVKQRQQLLLLKSNNPDLPGLASIRENPGRPRLEDNQEGLLDVIREIALHGASAADKRRSAILRSCRTLDDLHVRLQEMGYEISRTSTYRRLMPRNYLTAEGKRHERALPVRLCRAQADLHKDHQDQHFCKATILGLMELASTLGPEEVRAPTITSR